MQYFVTGATGFIGKRLVKKLLERKGSVVYFLLRKESESKVAALRQYWGTTAARAEPNMVARAHQPRMRASASRDCTRRWPWPLPRCRGDTASERSRPVSP